jgi:isoleucyl-tRNA synthetase
MSDHAKTRDHGTDESVIYPGLAQPFHDAESERGVSEFWQANDTFRRSIKEREGCPSWVFYEGPPTANGMPGVHHAMARLTKDISCRYKTMTGHRVIRKAGWDTHGLPVERSVEKAIGIQGRAAIEEFGLEEFNTKCRESVWACKSEWDEFTERLGYWVDLDDPYVTYDNKYIETLWWILAQFNGKGMLYHGHKVVPYCPCCGTPISSHEMANSYQSVDDPSIYVRLKATDADESFLTWTTTPWTLPSNVALAIGVDFDYVRVRHGDEILILAEARLGVLDPEIETEILDKFKGSELLGRHYEQLFPFCTPEEGVEAFKIVAADFVTLESGSGIVHMAPAFGEDDYQVGRRENLAFFRPVDAQGQFTAEVAPYAGQMVKKADKQIIKDLRASGQLLRAESYKHDYPFHDRCGNPLIYFATPSWFIKTSEMREQLVKANEDIIWAPPEVGANRFGNWLKGNIDWSLSRNRFWGTPLNVWICDTCGENHLPTCRADLTELTGADHSETDLHRPHVDGITFGCVADGCSGTMTRTPEVIDCWFDSGAMPFAQYHYPFENKELFESQYPADFISEGIDQTRGWYYTMLVISTFLTGKSSYKRNLTIELILDKHGKKMSKSVGNTVDPMAIMRDVGADPLRWYMLTASPVWTSTKFDIAGVKEAQRKLLATLENTYAFFSLYANLDNWRPDSDYPAELTMLDHWILSRLNTVTGEATSALEAMDFTKAARLLAAFVQDDLSNWYVRLSRRRFWKGDLTPDKQAAFATLFTVLDETLRLLAPMIPFATEEIWRSLHADQANASIHLQSFPEQNDSVVDEDLESIMKAAQAVVATGRSLRQDTGIRTRQPLGRLLLHSDDERAKRLQSNMRLQAILREELNLKTVELVDDPRSVATLIGKANFRALGPRFGKKAPIAAKTITGMTPEQVLELRRQGSVKLDFEGEPTEFTHEEIQVIDGGIEPFVAGSQEGLTVAIDTTLTSELKDEGLCREIINKVQNLRKKSGLEVADRITLFIDGDDDVAQALGAHADYVVGETLAILTSTDKDLPYHDEFVADGHDVTIALDRRVQE